MAYLALARKWRPRTFSEVVGQTHVVRALSNALDSGRIHHAFLFTGTRGVGKTTLARIFAKSLNCEEGTGAEPCQKCDTCLSIDEGRYVDLIEVDAASRTKVDDTREMLENVQYAPTVGKYKVYLIDEVHMLSGHSFNALLKTLEEPPEHVKFLFATTDPQKVPVTVLSRCLQFNLRAMRPEQIENQLSKILEAEGISHEQPALRAIAKAADGSMRDGLSLLDQAIAQGKGVVASADVEAMLGTIKSAHSNALIEALIAQDADAIMQVVADMADHAVDFVSALDEVLMQLYNISLAQVAPAALAGKDLDAAQITTFAEGINAEQVQLYYQIGLLGKRDITLAPSLRVGFEMALLRMLVFEPADNQRTTAEPASVENKPAAVSGAQESRAATQAVPQSTQQPSPRSEPSVQTQTAPQATAQSAPDPTPTAAPAAEQQAATHASAAPAPQASPAPAPQAADQSGGSAGSTASPSRIAVTLAGNNEWGEIVEQSELTGLSKELAMNCAAERLNDERVELAVDPAVEHLFKPERLADITAELQRMQGANFKVELNIETSDKETPAECLTRLGYEQLEQTRENLHKDPGVQALMSEFGATINERSIKPV